MATQPGHSSSNLDNTDELPALDVEAYEASLAEKQQGLSRTDTWTADALQDMDELAESVQTRVRGPGRASGRDSSVAAALTLNVERILKRIADLEADIAAAHDANIALQKRSKALENERDQQNQRVRSIEAENARLAEHRDLADGKAECLEHQLRELSQHANQEREELLRRIAESTERGEELQKSERALRDELGSAVELADERANLLAAAEKSLGEQKSANTNLARQLTAKLKDCERLASVVEQGDRSISDLTAARDALNERLQQETAARTEQAAKLDSAREEHEAVKRRLAALQTEHKRSLGELKGRSEEIAALRNSLEAAERRETDARHELEAAVRAAGDAEPRRAELEAKLRQTEQRMAELVVEHDAGQAQLSELEQAVQARDELVEGFTKQLQTARDEQATMVGQLSKLRGRVKVLTEQIFSRDNEIAELREDLAVHSEALDAIRRDVNRIGGGTDEEAESFEDMECSLEPIEHDGEPILLNQRSFTIGRTSENDICLPSHLVSRHHARLLVGPSGVIVEDMGSTNGCFVNGEQVRHHLMRDGDVLEIGDLRYRLCARSANDTLSRGGSTTSPLSTPAQDRAISLVPTLVDKSSISGARTELN